MAREKNFLQDPTPSNLPSRVRSMPIALQDIMPAVKKSQATSVQRRACLIQSLSSFPESKDAIPKAKGILKPINPR